MSRHRFSIPERHTATRLLLRLAALAAACLPATGMAQTPFALVGLGQNVENDSARDTGRGGWGMAVSDTLTPGTRNPAALATLSYMGLVVSGFGEVTTSKTGSDARTTRGTYLPNVRLAAPLRSGRLVLHAGFSVHRSMRFDTIRDLQFEHFDAPVTGYERYTREGTLYCIPMGLSWRAARGLSVAGVINLLRGSVTDKINQVFTDPVDSYYQPNIRESTDQLSGTNVTLALLWDGMPSVQLGASVTTGYDLALDRTVGLGAVAERLEERFVSSMPPQYKAGVQFKLAGDWRFGADGQYARFGGLSGYPAWESVSRDEWTFSAGFERALAFREHGRGYVQPWRIGYRQRQWAHSVAPLDAAGRLAADGAVLEHAISVGTGFPFRNRLGSIDLALSYIWIGSVQENGHSSRTLRLGVSITGLERLVF